MKISIDLQKKKDFLSGVHHTLNFGDTKVKSGKEMFEGSLISLKNTSQSQRSGLLQKLGEREKVEIFLKIYYYFLL